jgi:hypothetical protein
VPFLQRYAEPNAISNAVGYAKFYSCSYHALIRIYDDADNVIETHEHAREFKEWRQFFLEKRNLYLTGIHNFGHDLTRIDIC